MDILFKEMIMSLNHVNAASPQIHRAKVSRVVAVARAVCVGLFIGTASLSTAVHAAGFDSAPEVNAADKAFEAGKKAITARKWEDAIKEFRKVVAANNENADAHNYLGYAHRNLNQMDDSFKHYNIALKLNPNHRGAHEYIGQGYLKINQPDKAREHLARLEKICGKSCEEYQDLAKSIAAYKAPAAKK
jgi:tetratricopeptide (TPR) repeat protein